MRKGNLTAIRVMRRWLAQAVVMALVLPVLVGLLPQPAVSASAALERDLLTSVCGQNAPRQQDGDRHAADHQHCVLCTSPGSGCCPSLAAAAPAFPAGRLPQESPRGAMAGAVAPPLQALLDASPPRGPPARS